MFTSAELIEALRRRARRSLRPEALPGEFPADWRTWFAAVCERLGVITGASANAIVAILAQRELRPVPRRSAELNQWQAFATLWRQQWRPAGPEDRTQRIVAFAISALLQLVFAILLLWLAYARYGGLPPPPDADVVQVEFIGEGTPQEQGGGAPSGPRPQPQPARAASRAAQPARQATAPAPAQAAPVAAASPPTPAPEQPEPQPPTPVEAAQPLQATEVAEPDIPFVVPPPQPRTVAMPQARIEVPQLEAQPEALPLPATAPQLPVAVVRTRPVKAAQVQVPELRQRVESLPAPAIGPPLPGVNARSVELPQAQISVPGLKASVESLPSPSTTPGNGNLPAQSAAQAGGMGTPSGAQPASTSAGAGAGPKTAAQPGAWNTARLGDDWGASDRNRPGGQAGGSGLFDENGRPRLAPGTGAHAGGGQPPGFVTEDIADLDRAGTWLKRPPIEYSPTAFDRYWMPGGTLLEEWVRKGVRQVQIRIPGTSKRITCVVSILQLGGGCGVSDPDMQDQEAEARPPPDIPWKPELQEK